MGQGNAFGMATDIIRSEQFLAFQEHRHKTAHLAFQRCVAPTSEGGTADPYELREEERRCVEEYALLYAAFIKKEAPHFSTLYQQHQQGLHEKARQQYMEMQARQQLQAKI